MKPSCVGLSAKQGSQNNRRRDVVHEHQVDSVETIHM
jgi:hypothetical protein